MSELRSARLMAHDIETFRKVTADAVSEMREKEPMSEPIGNIVVGILRSIETTVQPGEIKTGIEIISGLPLEEQRKLRFFSKCPADIGMEKKLYADCPLEDRCAHCCLVCWGQALASLYKWNGTSWELATEQG